MLRHTLWLLLATAMAAPAVDSAKSSARYEQVTIQHGGGETETLSLMVLTVRVPQCNPAAAPPATPAQLAQRGLPKMVRRPDDTSRVSRRWNSPSLSM